MTNNHEKKTKNKLRKLCMGKRGLFQTYAQNDVVVCF